MVLIFSHGMSFYLIPVMLPHLIGEFGWSRAEVSLGFSLSLGLSGLAAPMVGRWVDRRGPRSAIILGATATAGTYLLLATTENLWQWYLYMSLNGLLRHFVFIIPFMALLARWFDRRLSVAGAVLGAGLMVGGMLVVPVMRVLIDSLEWQGAFVVAGVSVLVVVPLLAVTVIRDTPADVGELPDGVPRPEGQSPGEMPGPTGGLSLRAALHTRLFWALTLGMTLYPFGMVTWVAHSAPFYESVGLSPGTAAFLISLSAALAIPPRLLAGHFADRISNLEY
ncbi:MAG: MFS transporter, partial [Dehalococcoidia bacterium]|nr:MFS transporter [Dehalococcoidia bacterium]